MSEADPINTTVTSIEGAFFAHNAVGPSSSTFGSYPPNPYMVDCPVPTTSAGAYDSSITKPRTFINPTGFQIISPGADRLYGIGGQYIANAAGEKLPFMDIGTGSSYTANSFQTEQANATVTKLTLSPGVRQSEQDNLSNFNQGRLE
ncbi:hypothetical protein ACYOEI_24420 [Singulisphaera rosea]